MASAVASMGVPVRKTDAIPSMTATIAGTEYWFAVARSSTPSFVTLGR